MNTQNRNLAGYIIVLGVLFLIFGIIANIALYVSFSDTLFYQLVYGAIGAGLDLWKAAALLVAGVLWNYGRHALAAISLCFFITLSSISIGAGFGFTQQMLQGYENKAVMENDAYKAIQTSLENTRSSLETARKDKQACDPAYITNCIKPAAARIDSLLARESELISKLANFQQSGNAVNVNHPMFVGLGAITGMPPQEAKYKFFLLSILVAELLGTISVLIGNVLNNRSNPMNMTIGEMLQQQTAMQQIEATLQAVASIRKEETPANFQ